MPGRKRQPEDSESTIYVGRDAAGTILIRDGQVTALDADGAPLGTLGEVQSPWPAFPDAGSFL